MQIQYIHAVLALFAVVICFKFSNFAYANTVILFRSIENAKLLFALNLVTLLMQIQLLGSQYLMYLSCYLL